MKSGFSFILISAAIGIWILRIAALFCTTFSIDFPITSFNMTIEIPIVFVTLICIILMYKRNFVGAIIYFLMYAIFFGMDINNSITVLGLETTEGLLGIIIAGFAILVAFLNFFDVILSSNKKTSGSTKKTDWFYQNEDFDRELDERADKNNYRIS